MHKFATTVLALALATTHGLLDEGGPIVQKKGFPKGLYGNTAKADSLPEHAAVVASFPRADTGSPVDESLLL